MFQETIKIDNLSKIFKQTKSLSQWCLHPLTKSKEIIALQDINLSVFSGEVYVLLGKNGAGKTTLLKILSSLILPTAGIVYIDGYDIQKCKKEIQPRIGFISGEERSFYWRLTGWQNMIFFASLYSFYGKKAKFKIKQLCNLLEIDYLDKIFQTYSSGMKQRLNIARGLLSDPAVLLLDEPTKSIDPASATQVHEILRKIARQGKAILFTTHNLYEAQKLANRLAILHKGRIKYKGDLNQVNKATNSKNLEESFVKLTKEK
ncbi:MAG: ABC transporter ATP-binding protein [Candidatus Kaelpia imicola]|nr:ABC transporter ATP-binding protein [Candidatus Kaelpia imicola]